MFRLLIAFALSLSISLRVEAASAASAYNGRFNNAVSGVVQQKLVQRGFAMNDPRMQATLTGLGAAATTIAGLVGTAAAVGGTPVWLTTLAVGALVGVITGAVKLALDGDTAWDVNKGTYSTVVSVTGPRAMKVGDSVYLGVDAEWGTLHTTAEAAAQYSYPKSIINKCVYSYNAWKNSDDAICYGTFLDPDRNTGSRSSSYGQEIGFGYSVFKKAEIACDSGSARYILQKTQTVEQSCIPALWKGYVSRLYPKEALSGVPASDYSKRLNPAITAAYANYMLAEAAKTAGYAGIAPDLANPVTVEDVVGWEAANPSAAPTVGDALAPMQKAEGSPVAMPETSGTAANPATSPGVNPAASQPQTNVGSDPGIGQPSLENVPTSSQILAPILGLLPDWRAFKLPDHQSECPKPAMQLWGKDLVMSMHCDLLEQNRNTLQLVMALAWTLAAAIIILGA